MGVDLAGRLEGRGAAGGALVTAGLALDVAYNTGTGEMLLTWECPGIPPLVLAHPTGVVRGLIAGLDQLCAGAERRDVRLAVTMIGEDARGRPFCREFSAPHETWRAIVRDLGRACTSAEQLFENPVAGHA
jgi:hypothetical protein